MKLYLIPGSMIYIIEVNGNRREDMFIDTHMHEMTYSKDSFLRLDEMVSIARQKGLGGICITDHDSMGLKDYAAEYTERTGFRSSWGLSSSPGREISWHLELRIIPGSASRRRNSSIW